MKKEYTKLTLEKLDENMNLIETEENIMVSLIADDGKRIREKATGITGTRVDLGTNDSEENYEEVDV